MSTFSPKDIHELVRENNVKFIRLQFTDIFGSLKNVAITDHQLEKALKNECVFDGLSIEGFVRMQESDMYLRPDLDTFSIFPWSPHTDRVARLICDVYNPDGTPFQGDPRYILKQALNNAKKMGYEYSVGPECEFFLFQTDSHGEPTTITHDNAGYFDLGPVDLGENARRDMVLALEAMGFEIEVSHHEDAPGQHEIDFKFEDALRAADNIMTFKLVIKTIAQRHGLHATFMPKPLYGVNGSGMHTHQYLFQNGKNVFFDPNGELELSKEALHFIGGLLKNARALSAVTNPTVNSYKRLVPDYEAPVFLAWSAKNRSPLIRIPAKRGDFTHIELRNPDPSCNPYLALALMLESGLDGIKNKLTPPPPVDRNIFAMSDKERLEMGIGSLPESLIEAVEELQKSDLAKKTLGTHVYDRFIEAKRIEWENYKTRVHQWEVDEYLSKY